MSSLNRTLSLLNNLRFYIFIIIIIKAHYTSPVSSSFGTYIYPPYKPIKRVLEVVVVVVAAVGYCRCVVRVILSFWASSRTTRYAAPFVLWT